MHAFWECPVAAAVCAQVSAQLPVPVTRPQLWLVEPPEGVESCVWDVVALAALTAMERGRAHLRAVVRGGGAGQGTQAAEGQPVVAPPLDRAVARAEAAFWASLEGFAALGQPRGTGWQAVGPEHPFLAVSEGRLRCIAVPVGP